MSSVLKKNNGLQELLKSAPGMYFIHGHGMKIIVCEAGSHSSKYCSLQKRNYTFFFLI